MRRHLAYLWYVLRHKWFVLVECLKLHVPLWIAISHDWDKFLPDEWFPYARTFYAPNGKKQYIESAEFARAWMLHQHRNKHHWQYWLWLGLPSENTAIPLRESRYLVWDRGELQIVVEHITSDNKGYEVHSPCSGEYIASDPMPDIYRREMLADWRGAGRALGMPDTPAWYEANKDKMQLHPETRAWIETELETQKELDRLDRAFKAGLFG